MMKYVYRVLCIVSIWGECCAPVRAQIYVPPPISDMRSTESAVSLPSSMEVPDGHNIASPGGVFARHTNHVNPSGLLRADTVGAHRNEDGSVGDFSVGPAVRPTILGGKNPLVALNNHPLPQGVDVAGVGHVAAGVVMTQGTIPGAGGPVQIIAPKGNKGVVVGGNVVNFDGMNDTFNGSFDSFDGAYDSLGD